MILVDQNGVCCLCVDGKGHGMEEATAVLVSRIQRAVMLGQVRYQVIFHNRDSRTCIDGARLEYDCIDSNKIYRYVFPARITRHEPSSSLRIWKTNV